MPSTIRDMFITAVNLLIVGAFLFWCVYATNHATAPKAPAAQATQQGGDHATH